MVTSHKQLLHLCVGKETNGPKAQRGQLRSEVDQFFPRTRHRDRFTKKKKKKIKKEEKDRFISAGSVSSHK
jgi:hypothetical protein